MPLKDWVHPFVESLSDVIVENLEEGAIWIDKFMSDDSLQIKDVAFLESAMRHYHATQFHCDAPMKTLLANSPELEMRMEHLTVNSL